MPAGRFENIHTLPFGWFARYRCNPTHEFHQHGLGGYQFAHLPVVAMGWDFVDSRFVPLVVDNDQITTAPPGIVSLEFFPQLSIHPEIFAGPSLHKHPTRPGAFWYRDTDWTRLDDSE